MNVTAIAATRMAYQRSSTPPRNPRSGNTMHAMSRLCRNKPAMGSLRPGCRRSVCGVPKIPTWDVMAAVVWTRP